MKVLVLGGGASGMTAAIFAAQNGADVTILEKKEQLGKKLSVTGNGKCNYGNLYMAPRYYYGHDETFIKKVLQRVPEESVIDWFEQLGMLSMSRKNYMYPATQSAFTVVSALKKRLTELNVEIITDCVINSVKKEDFFVVSTSKGMFSGDKVIFSMGSQAGVHDKVPFNGYDILESLGHSVYPALPALCGLCGEEGFEEAWAGVRIEGAVSYKGIREEGEIQLTKEGVSGIPVFQLSHPIVEELEKKPVLLSIDFLPNYDEEILSEFLTKMKNSERANDTVLSAVSLWIPKKLCTALLIKEEALLRKTLTELTDGDIQRITRLLKEFPYRVKSHMDFESAQVANGGVATDEIYDSMESRLVPGLFLTGEILDVDGKCGGYNLHFAFATGRIAGEECVK